MALPGLKCSNSANASLGSTSERARELVHVGDAAHERDQHHVAEQLERRGVRGVVAELDHLAGHRLEQRPHPRAHFGRAGEQHQAGRVARVLRAHEDRRVDEGEAALGPAPHALAGRRRRGRGVVDDDRASVEHAGQRFEHGVDRRVVAEREVELLGALAPRRPGSSNALAPSASSARAFSAVRFQTCTVSPRSSSLRTNPLPSSPVPKYAINLVLLQGQLRRCTVSSHTGPPGAGTRHAPRRTPAGSAPASTTARTRERPQRRTRRSDSPRRRRGTRPAAAVAEHHRAGVGGRDRGVPLVVRRDGRARRHPSERRARVAQRVVRRHEVVGRVERAERDQHERRERERGRRPAPRPAQRRDPAGEGQQRPGDPQRGVVHAHPPDQARVGQQHDREAGQRQPEQPRAQRHKRQRHERFEQVGQPAHGRDRRDEGQRVGQRRQQQRRAARGRTGSRRSARAARARPAAARPGRRSPPETRPSAAEPRRPAPAPGRRRAGRVSATAVADQRQLQADVLAQPGQQQGAGRAHHQARRWSASHQPSASAGSSPRSRNSPKPTATSGG